VQVKLSREHTADSSGKFSGPALGAAVLQVEPSQGSDDSKDVATPAAANTRHNSQALQGSGGALPWTDSAAVSTGMHGSGGTYDLATCSTGLRTSEAGLSSRGIDSKISSAAALLKQRSDVAVLRDLKIGPLLGRGSYGRVYRGKPMVEAHGFAKAGCAAQLFQGILGSRCPSSQQNALMFWSDGLRRGQGCRRVHPQIASRLYSPLLQVLGGSSRSSVCDCPCL
jgi:hypothetical protein